MKKYTIIYYILLLFITMGAFASMALNGYGVILMSYALLGFALLFGYELIFRIPQIQPPLNKKMLAFELILLLLISLGYFLRGLTIDSPIFQQAAAVLFPLLLAVNAYHGWQAWQSSSKLAAATKAAGKMKTAVLLYFASLLLAMASGYSFQLPGNAGIYFAFAALGTCVAFLVIGWWKGKVMVEGEETNALRFLSTFQNNSGIQLAMLLIVVSYFSLDKLNVLPPLYFGSLPNGYLKVVRNWETGKNNATTKATDPAAFEEAYKKFINGK